MKTLNFVFNVDGVLQIVGWFPFLSLKAGFYNSENTGWVAISCQHTNQKYIEGHLSWVAVSCQHTNQTSPQAKRHELSLQVTF